MAGLDIVIQLSDLDTLLACSYKSASQAETEVAWTWDPPKNAANLANHKLPLAAGIPVLDGDPLALSKMDSYLHEERWNTIGSAGGVAILFVVQTMPEEGEDGRIISVRKATSQERREYEKGIK